MVSRMTARRARPLDLTTSGLEEVQQDTAAVQNLNVLLLLLYFYIDIMLLLLLTSAVDDDNNNIVIDIVVVLDTQILVNNED